MSSAVAGVALGLLLAWAWAIIRRPRTRPRCATCGVMRVAKVGAVCGLCVVEQAERATRAAWRRTHCAACASPLNGGDLYYCEACRLAAMPLPRAVVSGTAATEGDADPEQDALVRRMLDQAGIE